MDIFKSLLSVCMVFICVSLCLFICLLICLFFLSVCLCVCLCVCVFICLFVCSLTWDNEDVPILVPVISTVACCTVTNCEPRGLVADQLEKDISKCGFVEKKNTYLANCRGWYEKRGKRGQTWGKPFLRQCLIMKYFQNLIFKCCPQMQLHRCGPLYLEWEGWKQC